ncbi:response regulator transcription factor [Flagellimonas myxillae]|uniref:response regulator transcription factor n=1 Tax=Flagellimonas myxillae TaxID=2942214 RepID=UPI00201E832D|nr:helix-turn-helix transcriptional regulator [Muricauda myxillae]MCL6265078.1 helix-turn-helix transcriptional regulator [Muricauda myxillae]
METKQKLDNIDAENAQISLSFMRTLSNISRSYHHIDEHCFTTREKEIIKQLALGLNSYEIADKLFISKHTVDTHKKNIYRKGKFNGLRDVILFALFMDLEQKNTQNWVFPNIA